MPRRAVLVRALVAAGVCVLLAAGCSSSGPDASTGGSTTTVAGGSTPRRGAALADAFGTVTVRVTLPDGSVREWCLWLADTDPLRQRGLMFVTDPDLEGHPGMLFAFAGDQTGGFWMRNTRLPLSIAYLDADGHPVSTTDMTPCPDEDATCPSYAPGGPYRYTVEVPQGRLGALGIVEGSTVTVGEEGCSTPPATAS